MPPTSSYCSLPVFYRLKKGSKTSTFQKRSDLAESIPVSAFLRSRGCILTGRPGPYLHLHSGGGVPADTGGGRMPLQSSFCLLLATWLMCLLRCGSWGLLPKPCICGAEAAA
ncbi:unnamed protein product [Rangifer tarandus platyrhynchus]|uniref:Uncharacterized protein n=2 Tax=Rangifer tarandus platyrhynchus TaxID=3082113 RepID=A0AC59Z3E2_RANTA|nr:unnamed protein product [Rangifer tarandus platyrhynchus]